LPIELDASCPVREIAVDPIGYLEAGSIRRCGAVAEGVDCEMPRHRGSSAGAETTLILRRSRWLTLGGGREEDAKAPVLAALLGDRGVEGR
jgi:hypothetical protein